MPHPPPSPTARRAPACATAPCATAPRRSTDADFSRGDYATRLRRAGRRARPARSCRRRRSARSRRPATIRKCARRGSPRARSTEARVRGVPCEREIQRRRRAAGGDRPRRARARRARAQRHGAVLRREPRRLRGDRRTAGCSPTARALHAPVDPVGRRVAAGADHGRAGRRYTQCLTEKPVKGMLTGPVTILAWSFVRDDQPLGETANQVALALRDEIADLEAAGIGIIQVDEPALRELLPLKKSDQAAYLDWSVGSFRLATAGVADRDADPHPPLLLGVRRGDRRDRPPRCRRHLDRGGPLQDGGRAATSRAAASAAASGRASTTSTRRACRASTRSPSCSRSRSARSRTARSGSTRTAG